MKSLVQPGESSSRGEALQVRGRSEQKSYDNNYNRDNNKNNRYRSKSRGKDKQFCRYCKKNGHEIGVCWKLQNKEKRNGTYKPKHKSDGDGKVAVCNNPDFTKIKTFVFGVNCLIV